MKIRVRAPASTANIGPGFDCLGAALTLSLDVEVHDHDAPTEGLIAKAVASVVGEAPNFAYEITGGFASGRGLGFSAAEVAAGLLIGCALSGKEPDPAELLGIGTPLEGHPDNLAPCLYGGITVVLPDHEVLRFEPTPSLRPIVLLPEQQVATKEARKVLPDEVPRGDAIANLARASGLLALLNGSAEATTARLLECTEDLIHQPYRAPLMPETAELVQRLRSHGIAAAVSGAGPSVVCLVIRGDEPRIAKAVDGVEGWTLLDTDWSLEGARIEPSG